MERLSVKKYRRIFRAIFLYVFTGRFFFTRFHAFLWHISKNEFHLSDGKLPRCYVMLCANLSKIKHRFVVIYRYFSSYQFHANFQEENSIELATKWLRILSLGGNCKIRNHLIANTINERHSDVKDVDSRILGTSFFFFFFLGQLNIKKEISRMQMG